MDTITIIRTYYQDYTSGQVWINDNYVCNTLELPYKNNERNISCIPEGIYNAKINYSKKHRAHILILKVKGRSDILLHTGNTLSDTQGCVLVGTKYQEKQLRNSKQAMYKIISKIIANQIKLKGLKILIISNEANIY